VGKGVCVIAVGDEVLYGVTPNTNAACIADAVFQRGYLPVAQAVTSDAPDDIFEILGRELRAGRDVITTGGLGPTIDDNTKAVAAALFSRPLLRNEALFAELASRYGKNFPTLENQSLQPEGCVVLHNRVGTAPGIVLEDEKLFPGARLFILPGPPLEMKDVLFHEVLPRFFTQKPTLRKVFRLVGLMEHEIDPLLRSLKQQFPQLRAGIYPSYGFVRVHFSVPDQADAPFFEQAVDAFSKAFPRRLYLPQEATLEKALHALLLERGLTIATAESCTGGGVVARLTSVPDASKVVFGGIVVYQDHVKESVLGVPQNVIEKHGAVSTEVTEQMAQKAKELFRVKVVCAVSGFFGPSGGTPQAPVGTVCASFLMPDGMHSERFLFHGTRESICEQTIQALMARLIVLLH
jgi:nicotinamide-nucleotide amidase